ncbi:MAG: SRPBCC domain-containing protein [Polyangiaceae bacterium]
MNAISDSQAAPSALSDIRIEREYPHSRAKVWRALTDPELIRRWLMRPEGFAPVVGTRFKLFAKPQVGWRGFVECEVTAIREQLYLEYTWAGDEGQAPTRVSFQLEELSSSRTRVIFRHTGFKGVGGLVLAKLMLGPGWRKMLSQSVPALLEHVLATGELSADCPVSPKFG